jgi:hypothetical protein
MKSYNGPYLKWFILVNVTNQEIDNVIKEAINEYSEEIDFEIHINHKNTGPGAGINVLNELSKKYEYSLFIEGDWICVPGEVTGFSNEWLLNSVKLLEENLEIDQVQFRKYLDDLDDRQYGYKDWIIPENIEKEIYNGDTFVILKHREYVNTPTLRRMSTYFKKGVFPLPEKYDENGNSLEIKGNDEWGFAEIRASELHNLNGAWLKLGNFIHNEHTIIKENWKPWLEKNKGCKSFDTLGNNSCKYGFIFFEQMFCVMCNKSKDYTDFNIHNSRFMELLTMVDADLSDVTIFEEIRKLLDNPVYLPETYLNIETYRKLRYNRTI